jgi:hypothetical protein
MNEVEKPDLRRASEWLNGEVEIRVTKKWLAIGIVILLALVVFALD